MNSVTNPIQPMSVIDETPFEPFRGPTPYWLHPFFLVTCCLGIPALVTHWLPASVFEIEWHTPKVFSAQNALTVAYVIAAFGAGALALWFWRQHVRRGGYYYSEEKGGLIERERILHAIYLGTASLSLFGSIVWIAYSAHQGLGLGDALGALRGDAEAVFRIRSKAATIPGLTTFTQFGMAAAILAGMLWYRKGSVVTRSLFLAIIVAAFLRAFLRAERLAFIEIIVPFGISLLPELIARWRSAFFRLFLLLMPAFAVVALVAFFTIAEAGRSYEAKLEGGLQSSATEYGANRIGGYYGTALNNGAYILEKLPPSRMPYFALEWFWKFPGLQDITAGSEMTGYNSDVLYASLSADMNVEFNNTSGIFCYEYDFGRVGLIVVSFFVGVISFSLFGSFRNGGAAGRLLYPLCAVAFMELARIPYLTSKRAFASVALVIFLIGIDNLLRISARAKNTVY
jgi:hypothetical protein